MQEGVRGAGPNFEYGSECALTSLAVDEPLEYARLYLNGNLQMWVDAEDSLEL